MRNLSKSIQNIECLEEVQYLLDSILSWDVIVESVRDQLVGLMPQLSRLLSDLNDLRQEPCKSCDIKSCPWRPDSHEECIYYSEQSINQAIEEENQERYGECSD